MPVSLLEVTKNALGGELLPRLTSRSLRHDRFADPDAREEARKNSFKGLIAIPAQPGSLTRTWHPSSTRILHARLMSRLMVNLASGVMENANLCLDRFGIPYIPGSAIKGCARRMALQSLHDWVEASSSRPAENDICTPCCEPFGNPAEMLAAVARTFGWVGQDWSRDKTKKGHWKSDFFWAAHGNHQVLDSAHQAAGAHDSFAGSIAFLPAYPNRDPGLELDVVTPHHTAYYKGDQEIATDTEDPVPVYFPAVKAQQDGEYFSFPLYPLRPGELNHAKLWLACGLELLGLGAKTAAGYGWFDASLELQTRIAGRKQKEADDKRAQDLAAAERRVAENQQRKKAEEKTALEGLSPDQQEDWKIQQLNDAQFDAKIRAFCKEPRKGGPSREQQAAIIRALKGSRLDYWNFFKEKAVKGDLATVQQTIRALNKQLHGDRMP